MAEGATNAGIEDIKQASEKVTKIATETFSNDGQKPARKPRAKRPAGANN